MYFVTVAFLCWVDKAEGLVKDKLLTTIYRILRLASTAPPASVLAAPGFIHPDEVPMTPMTSGFDVSGHVRWDGYR